MNQLMGLDAHHNVGGFDADHQVIVAHLLNQSSFFQSAFYQPLCSDAAVFFDQTFFQRAAVYTYSNGNVKLLGPIYHSFYSFLAADIAGVDADLVSAIFHGCNSQTIIKVNVCHQRNMNLFFDFL